MTSSRVSQKSQLSLRKPAFGDLRGLFQSSRLEAGLDIEMLAANALVSISTIMQLESAPENVRLEDIFAVANALNIDPGDVLDRLHSANR